MTELSTASGLHRIGWRDELPIPSALDARLARVIVQHRSAFEVHDGESVLTARTRASARRRDREDGPRPVVGDFVWLLPEGDGFWQIHEVLPRRGVLRRLAAGESGREQIIASHIDFVLIVCGLDGDFNSRRIERYLAIVGDSGATPIIVLTKVDTCATSAERCAEIQQLAGPEVLVCAVNARDPASVAALRARITLGHTAVLVGSSGAGKSTLTNSLLGIERMRTGAVRAHDSRGRHTTTFRALIELPGGGCLIDTPGMREIKLTGDEMIEESSFADVEELAAACRFRDCAHGKEPGCAVQAAIAAGLFDVERYANYQKLLAERDAARQRSLVHEKRAGERQAQKQFGATLIGKYGKR